MQTEGYALSVGKKRVGVAFQVNNFDRMFDALGNPPVIINDESLRYTTDGAREELASLIYECNDGDELSAEMSCSCGKLRSKSVYKVRCNHCGTYPSYITERPIESNIWMKTPIGIDRFINPVVWGVLTDNLTYRRYNIMEYLTRRRSFRPRMEPPPIMMKVERLNLPGTLNEFVERFDEIIEVLYVNKIFKARKQELEDLMTYLRAASKIAFPKHLPFPSKLLMIQEKSGSRTMADHSMITGAVDALLGLISLNTDHKPPSDVKKEARTVEAISKIDSYCRELERERLLGKTGLIRKLLYGTQPHYSFRAVIITDHGSHDFRKLKIPYGLSVLLLENHILSKCLHRGLTPVEASELIHENIHPGPDCKVHPLLRTILQELLDEAGPLGIPITWTRWPTIYRGSILGLYIGSIKFDHPHDCTVSMPSTIMKLPNADVDGDALGGAMGLDKVSEEAFKRLSPHLSLMDANAPFRLTNLVALPVPAQANYAYYVHEGDQLCPVDEYTE